MTFHRRSLAALAVALLGLALLGLSPSARAADEATHTIASERHRSGDHRAAPALAVARGQPGLARVRTVTAGREAARVPADRRRDQPPVGIHRARDRGRSARLSHDHPRLPQRGGDRGDADREPAGLRERRAAAAERHVRASRRAWRSSTGRDESTVVERGSARTASRTASTSCSCTSRTPTPRTAGRSSRSPAAHPETVWSETVIAGSSLGAGEALMIAQRHDVYRAALLHGWVDARYDWVRGARPRRPRSDYFTLIHQRDAFFGTHVLRVPRARPDRELPAGRFPGRPGHELSRRLHGPPGQPAVDREPRRPAVLRPPDARVQSQAGVL